MHLSSLPLPSLLQPTPLQLRDAADSGRAAGRALRCRWR